MVVFGFKPHEFSAACIALLIVLFSHLSYAKGSDDLSELAYSKQWLRLLHFKKSFPFGTLKSEVDDASYFFSPQGSRDPHSELLASIQAFHTHQPVGRLQLSAECAFPARYYFLRKQLHWTEPEPKCEDLERFLKTVGGETLGLVFSTAYPNSPPSMFGHTLLRIHSQNRAELLDYGINFAALSSPDDNAIAFAILGFFRQFEVAA